MVKSFLNYLEYERAYSQITIARYRDSLRDFERYFKELDGELLWTTVDQDVIRDWLACLMDKGEKPTTINAKLSAVRSFFRFALSRKLVSTDPAHKVTGPKKNKCLPQFVRESEMDALFDQMEWTSDFRGTRDKAILMTFYETGIRQAELLALDDCDVDFSTKQLKVTGKRNKQRIVPFGDELFHTLLLYKEKKEEVFGTEQKAFFLTEKGERVYKGLVYRIVKDSLSLVCSLKKKSPHVLRHTFATAMLNHEAGLESVQKLLGHTSLKTTEIYTHTTFEQLKKVYNNAHPRA